jgi:pSer/pThr/pTyr-binding forkhead associated (FHA) protein
MFKLVIQDDEGKTTVVPLIRDEITIGRKEGNTIRLTERNVSRRHARILRANGEVQIEDLGSYNGIRVNNARIAERVNLRVSDQVQIGDYKLYLKAEGVEQVDDARTMPIERVEAAATDILPAVSPAPTAPIAIPATPALGAVANGTGSQPAVQVTGNPNRTLVAMADTDPTTGRPLASPALIAAAIPQQTGFGKLVVLSSNFAGKEYELARPQMIIGRTDENDLVINHRSISRNHAKVVREPDSGRYTISDLQSSNGVRVNGNDYSKVELRRGDVVDLGHVRLRFVEPGEDFVFSRDAVITDVPETGGKKGLLVAIILGVLVLGGVLVFVLTRGSSESGKGDGSGTNGMVNNPKPDAPEVAVNPPADAEVVAPPPIDSGSTAVASDEVKKLLATCAEYTQDRKWLELEECGHQLERKGHPDGEDVVKKASEEARNEVKFRAVTDALKNKDPDLKAAGEALAGIKTSSVYQTEAQKKFDAAKADVVSSTVADLKTFIREKDCKKYDNKSRNIGDKYGKPIIDEAQRKAGRCSEQTTVVVTPPPKTCDPACGEGFVCKGTTCQKKDPGVTVTPPPACDPTVIANLEATGDQANTAGSYAAALSSYEGVFKCKPAVAQKAYLAACRARNFPKAKLYFKIANKESLAQICLKEGYDPRTP